MLRPIKKTLLTLLGRLKYFSRPPVVVFDPSTYRVKGRDCRELLNLLQPGDILLRAYEGYVDSWFIRRSRPRRLEGRPKVGTFTHVGLYVGELRPEHRALVARDIKGYDWDDDHFLPADELPAHQEAMRQRFFDTVLPPGAQPWPANGMVVHAMADGVQIEDVLTFSRCDYLVVLRLPEAVQDGVLPGGESAFVCRAPEGSTAARQAYTLDCGGQLSRAEAVETAIELALGKVGSEYDFDVNDLKKFNSFSCAQLVFYAYRALEQWLGLRPRPHGLFGRFAMRNTVSPDDFLYTRLLPVWKSASLAGWEWPQPLHSGTRKASALRDTVSMTR